MELSPDNRDGLWLAAQCCLADRQFAKARDYATRSIKLYPNNIGMYAVLADIELQAGNQDKAVAAIEDGLKATSRNPQLLWDLANVLIDVGKPKEAENVIRELATADYPKQLIDYLKARNELAQGHWLAARQGLEKVRGTLYPVAGSSEASRRVDWAVLWQNGQPRIGSGFLPPRTQRRINFTLPREKVW